MLYPVSQYHSIIVTIHYILLIIKNHHFGATLALMSTIHLLSDQIAQILLSLVIVHNHFNGKCLLLPNII